MTFYERISPLNNPQDFGISNNMVVWAFEVIATKRVSKTTLEEIYSLIADLVAYGNVLCGSKSVIPDGSGPYLTIREMGGAGSIFTHNEPIPTVKVGIRITARAVNSRDARAVAFQAYEILVAITNTEVTPATIP